MTPSFKIAGVFAMAGMLALTGCSGNDTSQTAEPGTENVSQAPPSPELEPLVVKGNTPANQVGVAMARESVQDGQDVIVEGRLKDFVQGKAAFTIVDGSIPPCGEDGMEDHCPTPWDYCCVAPTKVAANSATVKLVGNEGNLLDGNLQGVNSIDNLSTVVVTGKAQKDEAGNLTIAANKVYLK